VYRYVHTDFFVSTPGHPATKPEKSETQDEIMWNVDFSGIFVVVADSSPKT
jgi:hypothetical protein